VDVQVAFLPSMIDRASLGDRIAVVIDVLRATTTIVQALAAGAETVIPCSEIDEALAVRNRGETGHVLTGGERHGQLIEGFDLDNSPFSYSPEKVAGRVIAFTTTNGTRAIAAASAAKQVLIGSFLNRRAVIDELRRIASPVTVVCAGTDGQITAEDVLVAGAFVAELATLSKDKAAWTVEGIETLDAIDPHRGAAIAARFSRDWGLTHERRVAAMRDSCGGQNLISIGNERDIERAADDSVIDLVPEWDRATGRITAPTRSG
jgi:2-phosphosulfolactate phosphatase